MTWGRILICLHPSSAGPRSRCEKPPQLCSETGPRTPVKVTRCRGFTSSSGPWSGIARWPKRPAPPVPPRRWPTWKCHPSAAAWEMPIGQICCCQQKTKPLPSPAAGDKRERAQEQPCGGPSGTMATFSGAGEAKLDKGSRCPQTPAATSIQNRGCKFGFFHLNPLRRCERGEQASTLACHTPSLGRQGTQPQVPGDDLLWV